MSAFPADAPGTVLIAMAFDGAMWHHAVHCIESINAHCKVQARLGVVGINLNDEQLSFLVNAGAFVFTDIDQLPRFKDAPVYACAQTCRPYLPEIFPGYSAYLYVDADIRFIRDDAITSYAATAVGYPDKIAIADEIDPAYCIFRQPGSAFMYHMNKTTRIRERYGEQIATVGQYMFCYNSGIFAMHQQSPVWAAYKRNLDIALRFPYDHMVEQDAMFVATLENDSSVCPMPSTMNWLCSMHLPIRDAGWNWVRPTYPHTPVSVLHLTASGQTTKNADGEPRTFLEIYRDHELTK